MASRLGVRRPTLLTGIEKVKEIKPSAIADGSVLIRCSGCGSWVDVVIKNVPRSRVVVCDNCGCVNLVTD
jgi:hypothetical protein